MGSIPPVVGKHPKASVVAESPEGSEGVASSKSKASTPAASAPDQYAAERVTPLQAGKSTGEAQICLASPQDGEAAPIKKENVVALSRDRFLAAAETDAKLIDSLKATLEDFDADFQKGVGLYKRKETDNYNRRDKAQVMHQFAQLVSCVQRLDALRARYADYESSDDPVKRSLGYVISNSAYALEMHHLLRFMDVAGENEQLEQLLDEGHPEFRLPKGIFTDFRERVANPWTLVRNMHIDDSLTDFLRDARQADEVAAQDPRVKKLIEWARSFAIGPMLREKDEVDSHLHEHWFTHFVLNIIYLFKDWLVKLFAPVQKGIAEWMGDTRVSLTKGRLISEAQTQQMLEMMEPGDILVSRQNWYLSNMGLPAFWKHGILHIGRPDELKRYFDDDPAVKELVRARCREEMGCNPDFKMTDKLSEYLEQKHPERWATYVKPGGGFHGEDTRFIEAVSEGVVFSGRKHVMEVDYLGVMRPNVGKADKAEAIIRAFEMQGRPYDFDFDFSTDNSIVCTELVYKAYQKSDYMQKGIDIPLQDVASRATLPANDYVQLYDREYGKPDAQLELVGFLDGNRKNNSASFSTAEEFRKSHTRSKWTLPQK